MKLRLVSILTLLLVVSTWSASAQPSHAPSGRLLVTIDLPPDTPARNYFQFSLRPGEKAQARCTVKNDSDRPMRVRVYATSCTNAADGSLSGPLHAQSAQAGGWTRLASAGELELAPHASHKVSIETLVPGDTAAGDHFDFVFVEPVATRKTAPVANGDDKAVFNIDVVQRIGLIVWTRVPGAIQKSYEISGVDKTFRQGDLYLAVGLRNTGNTWLKPVVSWTLKSPGREVVASGQEERWGYLLPKCVLTRPLRVATSYPLARGAYVLELEVKHDEAVEHRSFDISLP